MPPTSINDNLWPLYWREELARPPLLPDLQPRSPLRSRSTPRSSPVNPRTGQLGPRSTELSYCWMCRCAYGNRGRLNECKLRRFRSRQRRPGPITRNATSLGFIGQFMQGSRVQYRKCRRVSEQGIGQARAALPGQRTQGAPTSHH